MKKIKWHWMSFETKDLQGKLQEYLTVNQAEDFKIVKEFKNYTFVLVKTIESFS
jgi:hypothetical protein